MPCLQSWTKRLIFPPIHLLFSKPMLNIFLSVLFACRSFIQAARIAFSDDMVKKSFVTLTKDK